MRKRIKGNVGNRIGFEFETEHETESEARLKMVTNPNVSDENQTKLIDSGIEHQKSLDKQKEGIIRDIGILLASVGAFGVADRLKDGKTTKQLINFFEKGIQDVGTFIKKATTKLLNK